MAAIDYIADRQAVWSATANALKDTVDRARLASFIFSILGALAAAIATQAPAGYRTALTFFGAAALAIAAFLTTRFLTKEALARHVRARAASEALKREAFLHSTGSGGYADPATKDALLAAEQRKIEDGVSDLSRFEQTATGQGNCPRAPVSLSDYVQRRVDGQVKYYRNRANRYSKWSDWLHRAEGGLAFLAAILTVVASQLPKDGFDIASLIAVLTTIGGAVLAHLQASRYDELVGSYRATARRLEHLKQTMQPGAEVASLAQAGEDIIANETQAWNAMWSK